MQLLSRVRRHLISHSPTTPAGSSRAKPRSASTLETLENRTLLSGGPARVNGVIADNRGLATITFDKTINAATITSTSVQVFTAGRDKTVGTADDVLLNSSAFLNRYKKVLTIKVDVVADTTYRIKLNGNLIKDTDGLKLDGEFNSGLPSGNGIQGGNFDIRVRKNFGANPIVRFTTNLGDMDVRMYRALTSTNAGTPKHVDRFLFFANRGQYDNNLIHRNVPNFVVQWGGMAVTESGGIEFTPDPKLNSGPADEPGNHNVQGSIAFALGGGPQTAGNEFFFNVVDNSSSLDGTASGGGPFTPFGRITTQKGFNVLLRINGLHRLDLTQALGGNGSSVDNVPVLPHVPVSGEGSTGGITTNPLINPLTDLVKVTRVAALSNIAPITHPV